MTRIDYKRNCPKCNTEIFYKTVQTYNKSCKKNSVCKKCKTVNNQISTDNIDSIIRLNSENMSNADIARVLDISYNSISRVLKNHNKKSNFINNTIQMVSSHEAKCTVCKIVKNIKKFPTIHKNSKYECKSSFCMDCKKNKYYELLNSDIKKYLTYRYRSLKRSAKERNILFSISLNEFMKQFFSQNGKCFYTDLEMVCKIGYDDLKRNVLSIDRVDTSIGYVAGNVVFTTYRINSIKNDLSLDEIKKWIPDWFSRIQKLFNKEK